MGSELRRHRDDVARRLHHPRRVPPKIKEAYDKNPKPTNLLLDHISANRDQTRQMSWRNVVAQAAKQGIPVPAFSTALAFYDSYRAANLPANLLASAARLFRRAHLRARGQTARRIFPHEWMG